MDSYNSENLLILTKTYPLPSAQYREHTCVVAINENGELRRLYPIPFRLLENSKQFTKWEWINAQIIRANSDLRPESHRIDLDSITLLGNKISTKNGWTDRLKWITPHISDSFTALDENREKNKISIGFIRPSNITLEITKSPQTDWTKIELQNLTQDGYSG